MVVRRTVNLPDSVDALVRDLAGQDESFSAAVARLIEAGARALRSWKRPTYVGAGEGPEDLGRKADAYLRKLAKSR
jgi:hypothetical protein